MLFAPKTQGLSSSLSKEPEVGACLMMILPRNLLLPSESDPTCLVRKMFSRKVWTGLLLNQDAVSKEWKHLFSVFFSLKIWHQSLRHWNKSPKSNSQISYRSLENVNSETVLKVGGQEGGSAEREEEERDLRNWLGGLAILKSTQ